ncbi:MAG: tRNA (N(6)-L-threonylcarbamoyladenosine(37)-C(2))-methylthiotransferase MtaB [Planctomycetaceae bacterium]|jgi:threonylcarbamoyladenosine tRNA methylthiotransferase MtaB|nr:tRNA (N(6)-L-threonylcarbamoyladenosine(37)-C(2))-methylthiotransferase MtaB [Planctomycetaceae bacterium]
MFFKLYTLGCKVNQYETEYLREGLRRLGYIESDLGGVADIVFLNTCAVTAESEAKCRKLIRKLINENRGAEVIVFGCSVRHNADQFSRIDGISNVVAEKNWTAQFLRDRGLKELPSGISSFADRHRAYVKVQDGCRVGCSYCIIPKVRSVLQSRPLREILDEVRQLVRNGYREIVLTGIHLGHYGVDYGAACGADSLGSGCCRLYELVERIIGLDGDFRIRLSSLEAVEVSDALVDLMCRNPLRICPHLHLPMQSGSDEILTKMRRRWLSDEYVNCCQKIMAKIDRVALTTDIIVGFPSETDQQFEMTCDIVRKLKFSKIHVFRFSPRKGTEAAEFKNQIPQQIIHERGKFLTELAKKLRTEYAASLVGMNLPTLFETNQSGTTDRYITLKTNTKHEIGNLKNILIKNSKDDTIIGD